MEKTYSYTVAVNTDRPHIGRIIICYSAENRQSQQVFLKSVYLKLGRFVLKLSREIFIHHSASLGSIEALEKQVLTILPNILIALRISLVISPVLNGIRSLPVLHVVVNTYLACLKEPSEKYSISQLMTLTYYAMENSLMNRFPIRINVDTFPSLASLTISMIMSYIDFILCIRDTQLEIQRSSNFKMIG